MTTNSQPGLFSRPDPQSVEQTDNFDRQNQNVTATDINWGLLRHILKDNPWPWPQQPNSGFVIPGEYSYQLDGTGVDFLIADTGVDAYHPEFIKNSDSSLVTYDGAAFAESAVSTLNSFRGIIRYNNNTVTVGDQGEIRFNNLMIQNAKDYMLSDVTVFQNRLYAVGGFYSSDTSQTPVPRGPGVKVLTSTTGQVWSDVTPYGTDNNYAVKQLRGAAASSSALVAVGTPGYSFRRFNYNNIVAPTALILRFNGSTWQQITTAFDIPLNYNLNRVRYINSRFFAVGDNGTIIVSTNDGTSWTRQISGVTCGLHDITIIDSTLVAVGRGGCILTSTNNGSTWTVRTSATVADLFCVTTVGSQCVALGQNGAAVVSSDAVNWSAVNTGVVNTFYAAQGSYLATGAPTRVQAMDWASLGVSAVPTSVSIGGYLGDAMNPDPASGSGGHGSHCASIAAGKSQGWAKSADIYSIRLWSGIDITTGSTLGAIPFEKFAQLIRLFHTTKANGRATVCNLSFNYYHAQSSSTRVTRLNYRGINSAAVNTGTSAVRIPQYGLVNTTYPSRNSAIDSDVMAATNAGAVIVSSAGNYRYKTDVTGGTDFNNTVDTADGFTNAYMRGATPSATGDTTSGNSVISVGAIDVAFRAANNFFAIQETKAEISHTGPRVDIYAAGGAIMGAYRNYQGSVLDPRSVATSYAYFLNKLSGTSMASPQIAGICCLLAQVDPGLTQSTARSRLMASAQQNKLTMVGSATQNNSTLPNYENYTSLQGGGNYVAYLDAVPIDAGNLDFINYTTGQGDIDLE